MMVHLPVLAEAAVAGLDPKPGRVFVDATLGGGGHALLIAERLGADGTLIGFDQDAQAIEEARRKFVQTEHSGTLPHVLFLHARFDRMAEELIARDYPQVDGVLFDLGVSSFQLDDPKRGFTFRDRNAPLDMRMDSSRVPTAADLLNSLPTKELAEIFKKYADERWSARIAEFVVRKRADEPYRLSGQLIDTIMAAVPAAARPKDIHPATRVFQALRIAVNEELSVLSAALAQAVECLRMGGRIAVISFHSGEDRIVKRFLAVHAGRCQCPPGQPVCDCGASHPDLRLLTKKPITATAQEVTANPRARSAKLRIAEKL